MLKIGEIAGVCGTSIKTLRHYNKIGVFIPKYIDPSNKYRYYGEEQVERLNFIMDLKCIGLSLNEILGLISGDVNKELLLHSLTIKRSQAEDNIKVEELKIDNINSITKKILEQVIDKNEEYDEKLERLISLDSAESSARHSIEEAIWL